ncbi:Uncharacterised protein [Bordetella pertussis]|nr:Uncharacterised protein [Bordetella pertussis]
MAWPMFSRGPSMPTLCSNSIGVMRCSRTVS